MSVSVVDNATSGLARNQQSADLELSKVNFVYCEIRYTIRYSNWIIISEDWLLSLFIIVKFWLCELCDCVIIFCSLTASIAYYRPNCQLLNCWFKIISYYTEGLRPSIIIISEAWYFHGFWHWQNFDFVICVNPAISLQIANLVASDLNYLYSGLYIYYWVHQINIISEDWSIIDSIENFDFWCPIYPVVNFFH